MSQARTCPDGHTWVAGDATDTSCPMCTANKTVIGTEPMPAPRASRMPEVPGYELLARIGQGGMGVVYKARQTRLNRVVALKMLIPGMDAAPDLLARFRTEAEAAARLQHPNIVSIYEVGDHADGPYLSLEFVSGGSLDKQLGGVPQNPAVSSRLVETVARAMHYAHLQGIVHRDLKPANILLDKDEGGSMKDENGSSFILYPSSLKVADFGLAKLLSVPSQQTKTGDVLGTPSYMAPEQAGGVAKQITASVDVYALGAILYEMLTGRPPFLAASPVETVLQVLTNDPVSLRRLQANIPRDLETIALRCLEKSPRKRYASAEALADDLRRFVIGEPIHARPVGRIERLGKWCRRHPAITALIGVAFISLVVGIVGVSWHAARLQEEVHAKDHQSNRAESHLRSVQEGISKLTSVSQEQLTPMPNTRQAQRAIIESALSIYQDLLSKEPGHAGMRHVQALALWELSKLHLNLERLDESYSVCREALARFEQLLTEDAANPTYRQDVARARFTLANIHRARQSPQDAAAEYNEARTRLAALATEHPSTVDYRRHLASVCNNFGNFYVSTQRVGQALPLMEEAVSIREQILRDDPADAVNRRDLAGNLSNLGTCYKENGDPKRSVDSLRNALALLRELPLSMLQLPSCRHDWALVWLNLGMTYQTTGQVAHADAAFRQAITRYEALVKDYPDAPAYRRELGQAYRNLGLVLNFETRADDAIEAFRQSCAAFERLTSDSAESATYQGELSTSLRFQGDLLNEQNRRPEAENVLRRAVDIARQLAERPNATAAPYSLHGSALYSLGIAVRDGGADLKEARRLLEEAAVQQARARKLDPSNTLYEHELAFNYDALAGVLLQLGKYREAVDAAEKFLEVSTRDKVAYCRAAAYIAEAAELAEKSAPAQAEVWATRAIALLKDAISKGLQDPKELDEYEFPAAFRARADFQSFLQSLEKKP